MFLLFPIECGEDRGVYLSSDFIGKVDDLAKADFAILVLVRCERCFDVGFPVSLKNAEVSNGNSIKPDIRETT